MKSGPKKFIITMLVIAAVSGLAWYFFKPDWKLLWLRIGGSAMTNSGTPGLRTDSLETVGGNAKVVAVFDGDTIAVEVDGKQEVVQAIGINAPEAGMLNMPVECYAAESLLAAVRFLAGKTVELKADADYPSDDGFGRLLRYIILPDGRLYNKVMLEEGYAYEYQNYPQRSYQAEAEFRAAQAQAQNFNRGLWSNSVCGFERSSGF
jgi:micrococcal nuclease